MGFLARLKFPPRVSRADFAFVLIPLVVWAGLLQLRPRLIHPLCQPVQSQPLPAACLPESVSSLDRIAIGMNSSKADGWSYFTQNLSGALAISVPLLWNGAVAVAGRMTPQLAVATSLVDLLIVSETTLWNGAIGESVRILVQRPRPFVFAEPQAAGPNPAHYISFYSGHTSFAAAATLALFLILLSRGAHRPLLFCSGALFLILTVSTGILRVFAGRHFPTDVMAAAVAGSLIALSVALLHRAQKSKK